MIGRYRLGLLLLAIVAVAPLSAPAVQAAPEKTKACPVYLPDWQEPEDAPLPSDYPPLEVLRAEVETNLKERLSGFAKDIGAFDGGARDWHPGGWCTVWRDNCTVCKRAKDAPTKAQCKQKHECSRVTQTYCTNISLLKLEKCEYVLVHQYREDRFMNYVNVNKISHYLKKFNSDGIISRKLEYYPRTEELITEYGKKCAEYLINTGQEHVGTMEQVTPLRGNIEFDTRYTPENRNRVLRSLRDELLFQKLDATRIFECRREK